MGLHIFPQVELEMVSGNTTPSGYAVTPWIPLAGVDEVMFLIEGVLMYQSDQVKVYPAIQLARFDPGTPGAWAKQTANAASVSIDPVQNNGDKTCSGVINVAPTGQDEFWVRFGVTIEHDSSATVAWRPANVRVRVQAREMS